MKRWRCIPGIEGMEARSLLSSNPALAIALAQESARASVEPVITTFPDPPPFDPGPGNPLPRKLARQRFHATFSGPLTVNPPLFTGQSKILYFHGTGTSNQFLHGDYQMAIILPKNPADPITGGAYLQDRNINSQGQIALDLIADPQSLDRFGRPTRLTFTDNSNIFAGIYADPYASGTVVIHYSKNNTAGVVFNGQVYASGITNPLRNQK